MTEVERYLSTCICCFKQVKVRNGLMVHHGFMRPGYGQIMGDCFGALKEPHELSKTTAQNYLSFLQRNLIACEEEKQSLIQKKETKYPIYRIQVRIDVLKEEIQRISTALNNWKAEDLITVTEEKRKAQEQKEERQKRIMDKRRAKANKAIESYQRRIDSAYKKNKYSSLADIYDGIPRKLREIFNYKISLQEALKMVDREAVWTELGVCTNGVYDEDKLAYLKISQLGK